MRTLQTQAEWCARAQWVLGVTLAVLVISFYVFGYRPNSRKLADLEAQIGDKRRYLASNRDKVQILPSVVMAVNDLRNKLDQFDKKLPKQPELGPFINDITELGHQTQIRKVSVDPGVPQRSDGNSFSEWPIALKFEGDFLSVFSFLGKTEQMHRLTRVRGLKIKGADLDGKPGQVQVELSMNIYYSEG